MLSGLLRGDRAPRHHSRVRADPGSDPQAGVVFALASWGPTSRRVSPGSRGDLQGQPGPGPWHVLCERPPTHTPCHLRVAVAFVPPGASRLTGCLSEELADNGGEAGRGKGSRATVGSGCRGGGASGGEGGWALMGTAFLSFLRSPPGASGALAGHGDRGPEEGESWWRALAEGDPLPGVSACAGPWEWAPLPHRVTLGPLRPKVPGGRAAGGGPRSPPLDL